MAYLIEGNEIPDDFPGFVRPDDPIVLKLTVPDDNGILRITRWSFPTERPADLFEDLIRHDPYLQTHAYTIERENR